MVKIFLFVILMCSSDVYLQKNVFPKTFKGKCYMYKEHAVHGYCQDVLGNVSVAQRPKEIEKKDKNLMAIMKNIELFVSSKRKTSSKQLMRYIRIFLLDTQLVTCERREEAMAVIDSITLPPLQELYDCFHKVRWKICHITHPLCSTDVTTGLSVEILPCQEHCIASLALEICKETWKTAEKLFSINDYCPRYYTSGKYLDCTNYAQRNEEDKNTCVWNNEYLKEERQMNESEESKDIDGAEKSDKTTKYGTLILVAMYAGIPLLVVLLLSLVMILYFCLKKYAKEKKNQEIKDEPTEYQADVLVPNHPHFKKYIAPDHQLPNNENLVS